MTQSEYENNLFFFAIVNEAGFIYTLPGPGTGGYSEYRTYSKYTGTTAVFYIIRFSGSGESYDEIRIIQISE